MSRNQPTKTDHHHGMPAKEDADRTAVDSLHGDRDLGTGNDSDVRDGKESTKAASVSLDPPGDPDDPGRAKWEQIAKHQGLLTPDEEMPTPHLPKK